jgi:phosphoserine phosphatase
VRAARQAARLIPGSAPTRARTRRIDVATTDLVIQAPAIGADDLAALAALSGAEGTRALDGGLQQAWRLHRIRSRTGVAERCAAAGIDYAFLAGEFTLEHVRVVALDMDSTLITIECVDEIADLLGIKPEVAAITAAAMRGEIDFRQSIVRRVALLAGLPVDALARVYDERVTLSPGAERMLAGFHAAGARTLLVSGGFTFFTERLKARLEIDSAASNTLEVEDGRLTGRLIPPIVDAQGKAAHLVAMREEHAGKDGIVVAIGDGANDLPMLQAADVSIAYRAKPLVRAQATCALNHCALDAALNLFL